MRYINPHTLLYFFYSQNNHPTPDLLNGTEKNCSHSTKPPPHHHHQRTVITACLSHHHTTSPPSTSSHHCMPVTPSHHITTINEQSSLHACHTINFYLLVNIQRGAQKVRPVCTSITRPHSFLGFLVDSL